DAEIWINEMRLTGLDERGGAAATARVDAQLADFGSLTLAGNISTIGYGGLDQKVQERQREEITGYDLAANFNLDKFFPQDWGLRLPFYAQYSKAVRTPEYDPYDLDIKLKDKISAAENNSVRDSIKEQSQEVTTIKSFNFTNVRKDRGPNNRGVPMPWDISNFSASYSYTETGYRDPIVEFDEEQKHTGSLDYTYSIPTNYIQPFKKLQGDAFKLISEFNFNPLPNSFSFSSIMNRTFQTTRYRFTDVDPRFKTFFNKRFTWDRDYDLQWDLTKSLKFSFNAINSAVIDEPDELALVEEFGIDRARQIRRDSIWKNIVDFGRPKNYQHNISVSYNLPVRYLPFLNDFVTAKVQYTGGYNWSAAALNVDSLGNVIQNNQNRTGNLDFNFEKLYDKVSYLRKINKPKAPARGGRPPTCQKPKGQKGNGRRRGWEEKEGKERPGAQRH
ncbi:MAG TPA: cell surface protein SprA, partial [Saprospiraceae bacterium]|nr:cell surface protein SprA [Saprospiraceae bacterium]